MILGDGYTVRLLFLMTRGRVEREGGEVAGTGRGKAKCKAGGRVW